MRAGRGRRSARRRVEWAFDGLDARPAPRHRSLRRARARRGLRHRQRRRDRRLRRLRRGPGDDVEQQHLGHTHVEQQRHEREQQRHGRRDDELVVEHLGVVEHLRVVHDLGLVEHVGVLDHVGVVEHLRLVDHLRLVEHVGVVERIVRQLDERRHLRSRTS
jgi:hypothetical protein